MMHPASRSARNRRPIRGVVTAAVIAVLLAGSERQGTAQRPDDTDRAPAAAPSWPAIVRGLSFADSRVQRAAFARLQAGLPESAAAIVAGYADARPDGKRLALRLLADVPRADVRDLVLRVITDPAEAAAVREQAGAVLAAQPRDELRDALVEAVRSGDAFVIWSLLRVTPSLPTAVALPVLRAAVPAAPVADSDADPGETGEPDAEPAADEAIDRAAARIARIAWQVAMFRVAAADPIGTAGFMVRPTDDVAPFLADVNAAIGRRREFGNAFRLLVDRSARRRAVGRQRLHLMLDGRPIIAYALVDDASPTVRAAVLRKMADLPDGAAVLLFGLNAATDSDRSVAAAVRVLLDDMAPVPVLQMRAMMRFLPTTFRAAFSELIDRLPTGEALRRLQHERDRLRADVIPFVYQRSTHDPLTARDLRLWEAVEATFAAIDGAWSEWWADNISAFTGPPLSGLAEEDE
jgi:hypothetical protein